MNSVWPHGGGMAGLNFEAIHCTNTLFLMVVAMVVVVWGLVFGFGF